MDRTNSTATSRPAYLRLSVTDRCNLRCRYCAPTGASSEQAAPPLSNADLVDIVARIHRARPLGKIRLTGGEPLMRPDLMGLVELLREAVPRATLAVTTNGTSLARLAEPLRAAGVSRLNISLDTLDRARFKRLTGAPLEPVIRGIAASRDSGFKHLKINAVLQRSVNGDELPDLVRFASHQGAEIRFIELMPVGCAASLYEEEHFSAADALDLLRRSSTYVGPLPSSGTAQRHLLMVRGRQVQVGFISPVSHPFCSSCNRLRLDSRGRLTPCLRSTDSYDLTGADAEQVAGLLAGLGRGTRRVATAWPDRRMVAIGG